MSVLGKLWTPDYGYAGLMPTYPATIVEFSWRKNKVATINSCDRCGAFGKEEVMSTLDITDGNNPTTDYEICSMCRVEFDEWLIAKDRQGAAVREKYQSAPKISEKDREMARLVAEEYVRAQKVMGALPAAEPTAEKAARNILAANMLPHDE